MNKDIYGEIINGESTYRTIADNLLNGNSVIIGWTDDGMYFECTYNGDKKELYIDAYKKWKNICKKLGEEDEEK